MVPPKVHQAAFLTAGHSKLVGVALRQATQAQVPARVQHRHQLRTAGACPTAAAARAAATPALVATARRRCRCCLYCLAGSLIGSQAPYGVQQHAVPLRHRPAGRHLARQHLTKPAGHLTWQPAQPAYNLSLHRRRVRCRSPRCRCCCGRPLLRAERGCQLLLLLLVVTDRARQAHACDVPRQAQQRSTQSDTCRPGTLKGVGEVQQQGLASWASQPSSLACSRLCQEPHAAWTVCMLPPTHPWQWPPCRCPQQCAPCCRLSAHCRLPYCCLPYCCCLPPSRSAGPAKPQGGPGPAARLSAPRPLE